MEGNVNITTAHPVLTIIFKNIFRTFEAEIVIKIFKTNQLQPKIRRVTYQVHHLFF